MATDKTSMTRIEELHPAVRESAKRAYIKACAITPKGVHPFITEAYRTFEKSDKLYAQGRTEPGSIVTNAKGGDSIHNYRMALDFVLIINEKMSWVVDENWKKVAKCFQDEGWEWGGVWKNLKDYPHVQKTMGYSLKQLKAKYKMKDFIEGNTYLNL